MLTFRSRLMLLVSTFTINASAHYELKQDYTGQNFFSNFDFYNGPDPTNGHVEFMGDATANISGLAGLVHYSNTTNPSEVVYLGVDHTTVLPVSKGRRSLRMESVQTFNQSLVIADILHQPSNVCGVWPAFWMLGTSATWPAAGEIDILEGVNDMNFNRMSMHTNAGLDVAPQDTLMSGKMKTANCDVAASGQDKNVGCMVDDSPSTNSYGAAFNQMRGGVFAMEYTKEAVKIWFFNRTRIPDDIAGGKPSPPASNGSDFHAWGKPTAMFQPTLQSNLTTHLRDLQLIFDTTFCGDWAGKVWNNSACAQLAPTCEEYVSRNPRAFDETYWLIKSLQVFQKEDQSNTESHTHTTKRSSLSKRNKFVDWLKSIFQSASDVVPTAFSRRSIPGGLLSPTVPEPEASYLVNTWLKTNPHSKTRRPASASASSSSGPASRIHRRAVPTSVDRAANDAMFKSYDETHRLATAVPQVRVDTAVPTPTQLIVSDTQVRTNTPQATEAAFSGTLVVKGFQI